MSDTAGSPLTPPPKTMKATLSKTLTPLTGIALVVPFVAVATYVGTRAIGGAMAAGGPGLLLLCLALAGVLLGAAAGMARERAEAREHDALHITARRRQQHMRKAFM